MVLPMSGMIEHTVKQHKMEQHRCLGLNRQGESCTGNNSCIYPHCVLGEDTYDEEVIDAGYDNSHDYENDLMIGCMNRSIIILLIALIIFFIIIS